MPPNHAFTKRQKERQRQERQKEKDARRQQRRSEPHSTTAGPGEDPDIAGIVPGPQPPSEDF